MHSPGITIEEVSSSSSAMALSHVLSKARDEKRWTSVGGASVCDRSDQISDSDSLRDRTENTGFTPPSFFLLVILFEHAFHQCAV